MKVHKVIKVAIFKEINLNFKTHVENSPPHNLLLHFIKGQDKPS